MAIIKTEVKIVYLRHPLNNIMSAAQRVGYYYQHGRCVGYKLQFPDGHTCHLTYAEIGVLMKEDEELLVSST